MACFFRLEIKRIFKSVRFRIAIVIGCLISFLQFLLIAYPSYLEPISVWWSLDNLGTSYDWGKFGTMYPSPWYETWIGGEWYSLFSYVFFMILPLLAVITHGDSLAFDKLSGYSKNLFVRGKRSNYYRARFLSSFFCGGTVVIIPLLLNILLCMATLPSTLSQAATGTSTVFANCMWSTLYYKHPMIYTTMYLLLIYIFSGLFSTFATAVGSITQNRFLPLIFPFIIYLFVYTIFSSLGLAQYAPFCFLTPAQRAVGIDFAVIVIEALIILIPTLAIFIWNSYKDETL